MNIHDHSSRCSILGVYSRIEAQDTRRLIKIHQMHSQSHMAIHHDSSICSIPGVYSRIEAQDIMRGWVAMNVHMRLTIYVFDES